MNNLTKVLLGGAALSVLAVVSAAAQQKHPAFNFTALHGDRVVNKTKLPYHCLRAGYSCTAGVYTYVSASNLHKRVNLAGTFYKWNSYSTICSNPPKQINKVQKNKTGYGKVGTATAAYSFGCASGPTTFYGDTYKLTDPSGEGKVDAFESQLTGTFKNHGKEYKGRLILGVTVLIEAE